jgi:hypothetical protein
VPHHEPPTVVLCRRIVVVIVLVIGAALHGLSLYTGREQLLLAEPAASHVLPH